MKKIIIVFLLLKISKESKRKYTYEINNNLNLNTVDNQHVLHRKEFNRNICENITQLDNFQIIRPHTKLGKFECPIEFLDNDFPLLTEEDVNLCLLDAENASNSVSTFDASSINVLKNETSEFTNLNRLIVPENSVFANETACLNVYNEHDVFKPTYMNDVKNKNYDFNMQNNKLQFSREEIVNKKIPFTHLKIKKALLDKKIFKDDFPLSGYIKNHTKRFKYIKEAKYILKKYKQTNKTYKSCFGTENDITLLENLLSLFLEFDETLIFNQDCCCKFVVEFDLKIFYSSIASDLNKLLAGLSNKRRKIIFFSELMRLYRFAVDVPELLTLGGLYFDQSYKKVIFVMHLINLFAENVKNIKENRIFFMLLIYKAYNCCYGRVFNLFRIQNYQKELCNLKHDFTFFTWEMTDKKRHYIKKHYSDCKITTEEKKSLKIVLLLFLCQHTIFIKYYRVDTEKVSLFQDFFKKVIQTENCVGCLFNEYLNILQQSIIKF